MTHYDAAAISRPTNHILQTYRESLCGTDPQKTSRYGQFNVFFNQNENSDAKMIIPCSIVNHTTIVISVRIITIGYLFPNRSFVFFIFYML